MPLLEVKNAGINFGGLQALSRFDLLIDKNEIVGLIGPNGAGKTTVFNILTGVYAPTEGIIKFNGHNIEGRKPYEIVSQGIARTFQNIRLFKDFTVLENIKTGYNHRMSYSLMSGVFRLPSYWKEEKEIDRRAREILDVFGMSHLADEKAVNLPYGQQRKLEIARALATDPKLLLLDEPAAGMNPSETQELMDTIRRIRDRYRLAVLLIEHDMNLVMGICERLVVLDYGQIIATGTPQEVSSDKRVIAAYLGE